MTGINTISFHNFQLSFIGREEKPKTTKIPLSDQPIPAEVLNTVALKD